MTDSLPDAFLDRWRQLSREKQFLNIYSELSRVLHWSRSAEAGPLKEAVHRAARLVEMTLLLESETGRGSLTQELESFLEALRGVTEERPLSEREWTFVIKSFLDLDPAIHEMNLEAA